MCSGSGCGGDYIYLSEVDIYITPWLFPFILFPIIQTKNKKVWAGRVFFFFRWIEFIHIHSFTFNLFQTYTPLSTFFLFSFLFLSGDNLHARILLPASFFLSYAQIQRYACVKLAFQHSKRPPPPKKKQPTFLFGCHSCGGDVLSVQNFYCSSYILVWLMDNTRITLPFFSPRTPGKVRVLACIFFRRMEFGS